MWRIRVKLRIRYTVCQIYFSVINYELLITDIGLGGFQKYHKRSKQRISTDYFDFIVKMLYCHGIIVPTAVAFLINKCLCSTCSHQSNTEQLQLSGPSDNRNRNPPSTWRRAPMIWASVNLLFLIRISTLFLPRKLYLKGPLTWCNPNTCARCGAMWQVSGWGMLSMSTTFKPAKPIAACSVMVRCCPLNHAPWRKPMRLHRSCW